MQCLRQVRHTGIRNQVKMSSQMYIWQYMKRNTGVCVKLGVISAVTGVTLYSKGQ